MLPVGGESMWRICNLLFLGLSVQRISVLAQDERPRAHAAPTGFNAIDVGGGEVKDFLKIPGGYRDGFQKVIFEEVGPANVAASPDLPVNDRFGAYDDNSVVGDNAEIPLFIPLPYRNETAEEKADRERKENEEKQSRRGKLRPTTTSPRQPPFSPPRTIISNAFNGQQVTIRPTVAPQPPRPLPPQQPNFNQPPSPTPQRPNFNQQPQPVPQQNNNNFNQRPFVAPQQPAPQIFNPPQTVPQSPPNSFQPPFNPQQTRPPFVAPQQPARPNPQTFIQPQRPGFTLQPPRQPPQFNTAPQAQTNFRPSSFAPAPQQTPSTFAPQFRTSQTPASRPLPQFASQTPRLPQTSSSTVSPFGQQNQFRQLRPFRPQNNFVPQQQLPSTTVAPVTRQQGGLRTGICSRTIYYKPQEASPTELRQTFSHFAVVVSVDQCARTAHEFNSAQAIFDPTNRHCQFNPGTTFSNPQACEQWPNPIYRNNLPITARPIIIRCVTCQARRRTPLRPFQRQNKALGISQAQFGPINRSTLARRIHGVIINDNMQSPPNVDHILDKSLEAERIVQFQPSRTTTNIEHLEPIKSSSVSLEAKKSTEKPLESHNDEVSTIDSTQKSTNEDKAAEQLSEPNLSEDSLNEETVRPFQRSSGIIVHKLHPIRLTEDSS